MTFNDELDALLAYKSRSKGYDGGKGQLWRLCRNLPHPLGEIIYKVIRFNKRGDPDDLVKIAGWARLLWEDRHADRTGSAIGDSQGPGPTRTIDQGPRPRLARSRSGDLGGDSRGSGWLARAEAVPPASGKAVRAARGTGAGGRRRKPVGRKPRRGDKP